MKILFVTPYVPYPPNFGGALRIYNLMKQAAKRHELSIVSYGTEKDRLLLKNEFGKSLKDIFLIPHPWTNRYRRLGQFYSLWTRHSFFHHCAYTERLQNLIDNILEKNQYHILHSEFAVMGAFNFKTDALKILDAHNVEYDNFRRMAANAYSWLHRYHYRRECKEFFNEEIDACRKHNLIFTTSLRDKQILDNDVPAVPKYVVPNGVDTSYFIPPVVPPQDKFIVFTGMMGYIPNYDGMIHFLDKTFPLVKKKIPGVKIYIVGKQPPKILTQYRSESVIITGSVPDVRPYVWRSSVYVVPLRMGGGTRLKVLEAMAMKLPIVSTTIGCEGIDVQDGDTLLIRDTPEQFADAVAELFENKALRNRLTEKGFEKVLRNYDWSVIGDEAERLYQSFAKQSVKRNGLQTRSTGRQVYSDGILANNKEVFQ